MWHRERRAVAPGLIMTAIVVGGCSSAGAQPAPPPTTEVAPTGDEGTVQADEPGIERPNGPSRQIEAFVELPARSRGVTFIVDDAVDGAGASFFASTGSGAAEVSSEWSGLALGELVELGDLTIEVTDIQHDSSVTFTIWGG